MAWNEMRIEQFHGPSAESWFDLDSIPKNGISLDTITVPNQTKQVIYISLRIQPTSVAAFADLFPE